MVVKTAKGLDVATASLEDVVEGIFFTINYKKTNGLIKCIISLSYSYKVDAYQLREAVYLAMKEGIFISCDTYNYRNTRYIYPASYTREFSNIISVSGIDQNGVNNGYYCGDVDVVASAEIIWSTVYKGGIYYDSTIGVSYATPIVSSVAGLILSLEYYKPNLLKNLLIHSTNRINQYDNCLGWGIIDAYRAVKKVKARPLNLQVTNNNGHPKLTWQNNNYNDVDYNVYLVYKGIVENENLKTEYTLIDVIDINQNFYIDFSETICRNGECPNDKVIKYRISKVFFNGYLIQESGLSNYAMINVKGYNINKERIFNNENDFKLSIFSNPSNSNLVLNFYVPKIDYAKIDVYNILGKKIKSEILYLPLGNFKYAIDLNLESSGIYFVLVNFKETIKSEKVVLIK